MEEESVSVIRETARNVLKLNRRFHRDVETDVRRCMENLRISPENVADIANKLKTKSSVSVSELQTLKNGLMENPTSITVVLNTHGALRGLVREISGQDVSKQFAAAGCLCNLAVADSRAGVTVAKAAGPYLVAALDSLTNELAVTCAWAVGNLAGSGPRASSTLAAQGCLTKLCLMLQSSNEEKQDAALYALVHSAYQLKDELGTEYLTTILEALYDVNTTMASSQLLFIISCHRDFNLTTMPEAFLPKVLQKIPISIEKHVSTCTTAKQCCELVYSIRTLANLSVNEYLYANILNCFSVIESDYFRTMMEKDCDVGDGLWWLLGNLFNFCSDNVFFHNLLK